MNVETEISGSDADLFEMENGDSFSLQPGATREIRIRFSPEPPPGEKSAFLDILGTTIYFEAALLIALIGFVSTVAVAKYLLRGDIIE